MSKILRDTSRTHSCSSTVSMLPVRGVETEAFLTAASSLRSQDVPNDLKASASRMSASVLFQQAAKAFESLDIQPDKVWPTTFDGAVALSVRTCEAYKEAVAESSDAALCKEVAPFCPEWPAAVTSLRGAEVEARKLLAELQMQKRLLAQRSRRQREGHR